MASEHFRVRFTGHTTADGATVYMISVVNPEGEPWCIRKRYHEIRDLHLKLLEVHGRSLAAFPPKRLFGSRSSTFIRQRQAQLQSYLAGVLELERPLRTLALIDFLGIRLRDEQRGPREEQKKLHNDLWEAARDGEACAVQTLLDRQANIDSANAFGETALHMATRWGHLHVLKMLLDRGARIDIVCKDGESALHEAALRGHAEVLRMLLDNQASIDDRGGAGGRTALHLAAVQGHVPVIQALLERGANVDLSDGYGETATYYAGRRGHGMALRVLERHRQEKVVPLQVDATAEHGHVKITCRTLGGNTVGQFSDLTVEDCFSALSALVRNQIPPPLGCRWQIVVDTACPDQAQQARTLADVFSL